MAGGGSRSPGRSADPAIGDGWVWPGRGSCVSGLQWQWRWSGCHHPDAQRSALSEAAIAFSMVEFRLRGPTRRIQLPALDSIDVIMQTLPPVSAHPLGYQFRYSTPQNSAGSRPGLELFTEWPVDQHAV